MKILIATQHFLDNNGGGSFASRAYINAFADVSEEVTLLYPDNGNSISEYINDKVSLVGVKNRNNNLGKLIDIYRGRIHRYANLFTSVIDDLAPDIVVFDNSRTSAGLIKKVINRGIKVITIHHDYEMEYYLGTPPPLIYRFPFMYYMRKTEQVAVKNSSINLALTNEDIELLRKEYDPKNNSKFYKLGVFEYKEDSSKIQSTHNDKVVNFLITGNLSAYQTEVSLIPFLENYYPALLKKYPSSKLIIAGRNPGNKIKELCASFENIQLIPNPEDMTDVLRMGSVYICPVNVGGGLKLRVMDGLKAGIPVLSHKVSCRGYEDFIASNVLFSYTDEISFFNGLNALTNGLINEDYDVKISKAYELNFSFGSGVDRIKQCLQELKQ